MPRGGARPGAGGPRGPRDPKKRIERQKKIAEQQAIVTKTVKASGMRPLEVILYAQAYWANKCASEQKAMTLTTEADMPKRVEVFEHALDRAVAVAEKALRYVHQPMGAVRPDDAPLDLGRLSNEQLKVFNQLAALASGDEDEAGDHSGASSARH